MAAGSVWDEIFDTAHVEVVRTYIERWPRKDRAPEKVLIVVVQPDEENQWLCPHCGRKLDPVEWDTRRWRTLDMHGKRCFLEAGLPRVVCGEHGEGTAAGPWARHDDRVRMPFEGDAGGLGGACPGSCAWSTGRSPPRCRGPVMMTGSACRSRSMRRGWPRTGRGRKCAGSCASPGMRWPASWRASVRTRPQGGTGWTGWRGSGSTRNPGASAKTST